MLHCSFSTWCYPAFPTPSTSKLLPSDLWLSGRKLRFHISLDIAPVHPFTRLGSIQTSCFTFCPTAHQPPHRAPGMLHFKKKLSHCDHGYPASSLSVRFSIVLSSSSKVSFGLQKNPWQHQPILKTLVPVLLCISILLKLCVSMYSVFVCFDAWQHSWSDFPLRSKALVSP